MMRSLVCLVLIGVCTGCGTSGPAAGGSGGAAGGVGGSGATGGIAGGSGVGGGLPSPTEMVPELLMAHGVRDVWVAATGERFVVGPRGMVARFDGTRWTPVDLPEELRNTDFNGVYGFAADNVYAVGEDYVVLHFDGTSWSVETTPEIPPPQFPPQDFGLFDVWGSSPDNVYAVGDSVVFRFDGDTWNEVGPSFDDGIRWAGVSGSSADNVFLAGRVGNFEAHAGYFNGVVWQPLTVPAVMGNTAYVNVYAARATDVYFAGIDGRISLWNGTTIADMVTGTSDDVTDVWGVSEVDVYAITDRGELLHFDGAWSSESNAPIVFGGRAQSLFGVSGNAVFAAGTGVLLYDGDDWSTELVGNTDLPLSLWAAGSGNALILGARTYRYDGTRVAFEDFNSVPVGTLTDAWGPPDQIIAVNTEGSSFLFDGVNWGERNTNNTEPLNAVWGSAIDDVFAVGNGGTILHFDGAVWEPMTSGTTTVLIDVHGSGPDDVYAIGGSGTIVHYDGNAWLPMNSGVGQFLEAVHVFSPSTIYALYDSGPSIGNGATWMRRPFEIAGETQEVISLDGVASDDFFLGSVSLSVSQISHYDGVTFTRLPAVFPSRVMLSVGPRELLIASGSAERYVFRHFVP